MTAFVNEQIAVVAYTGNATRVVFRENDRRHPHDGDVLRFRLYDNMCNWSLPKPDSANLQP